MSLAQSHLPLSATDLTTSVEPAPGLRSLLWVTPIICATVLSKIAVPPFGAQGIGIALPVLLVVTFLGCLTQQFEIDMRRFVVGTVVLTFLGMSQLLKTDDFSPTSLLLLIALHVPLLLRLREPLPDMRRVVAFFSFVCAVCAVLGILQFALQGRVENNWLFPIENFVPDAFRVQNFNEQAPLEYGSEVLRANGVFMMEPSYLSQLLAIGIIVEMVTRHRWMLLLLYFFAMVVSYSGTGFMVLGVCVPLVLISQQRWVTLLVAVVSAVVFILAAENFGEALHLDTFIGRLGEFNSTGSSGFARFVGGFYLFDQFLWAQPLHALFGVGAGGFKDYAPLAHFPVAEMPLFKMVLEFGLFGAIAYFAFLFFCLSSARLPASVSFAVACTYLLNGLYIPFAHALALTLLVWTSASRQPQSLHSRRLQAEEPAHASRSLPALKEFRLVAEE
jgi:hypothetical protein